MTRLSTSKGTKSMHISFQDIPPPRPLTLTRHSSSSSGVSEEPTSSASNASAYSDLSDDTVATTPPSSPPLRPITTKRTNRHGPVDIILGTATFGDPRAAQAKISDPATAKDIVEKLLSYGYTNIDTARAYPVGRGGTSELLLGQLTSSIKSRVSISSKVTSFLPGAHRPANLIRSIDASLSALGVSSVDILYLHSPDRSTSLEETLSAMNEAHEAGKFCRLGLSNYTREEVELVCLICEQYNFVRPSVYQGMYNPLCRDVEIPSGPGEESLLDVLRRNGISFHAYSPSAAGFFNLTLPSSSLSSSSHSPSPARPQSSTHRFDPSTPLGSLYHNQYFHPYLFRAASKIRSIASSTSSTSSSSSSSSSLSTSKHSSPISAHDLALRWTIFHSALDPTKGDAVVIGVSSLNQLEENLRGVKERGELDEEMLREVEVVSEQVLRMVIEGKGEGGPRCCF
ncbi:putative aldo keto [Phaeomoniella chlamydospora]|uniref:Putative aldo keto n=1 Tax=Phaeomoniella chlamydospora TaxID=158046 RepID=A0A0G2DWR7_PHACM|nr:putative aldo keto [Phaeomoniella chlamydospora]